MTPTQSSTPLTDAQEVAASSGAIAYVVPGDFARALERANAGQAAALKAEQERHQITCEALRDSEHECNVAEQQLAEAQREISNSSRWLRKTGWFPNPGGHGGGAWSLEEMVMSVVKKHKGLREQLALKDEYIANAQRLYKEAQEQLAERTELAARACAIARGVRIGDLERQELTRIEDRLIRAGKGEE